MPHIWYSKQDSLETQCYGGYKVPALNGSTQRYSSLKMSSQGLGDGNLVEYTCCHAQGLGPYLHGENFTSGGAVQVSLHHGEKKASGSGGIIGQ